MNLKLALRWALLLVSLLAVGPLCAGAMRDLRDADGGHAVSMLTGGAPVSGLLAGLPVLAGAAIVGWLGAHFFALSTGFASAGFVLAWGAWRTGTFDALVRRTHDGADLPLMATESAITILACAAITALLWHAARAHRPPSASGKAAPVSRGFFGAFAAAHDERALPKAALASILAAAAGGAVIAYMIAATPLKGQAVFAAFVGAIAAGVAAQFAAQSLHASASPVAVVLGLLLPAIAGPLIIMQLSPAVLTAQTYAGTILPLARIMPLDWAAGAMLGAPIGLGWAGAMMDVRMV